jgi:hypothetical protein
MCGEESSTMDIQKLVENEVEKIPQNLKPVFARAKQQDTDQVTMTLSYMAYAYGKAFIEYAERALDDWPKKRLHHSADGLPRTAFDGVVPKVGHRRVRKLHG